MVTQCAELNRQKIEGEILDTLSDMALDDPVAAMDEFLEGAGRFAAKRPGFVAGRVGTVLGVMGVALKAPNLATRLALGAANAAAMHGALRRSIKNGATSFQDIGASLAGETFDDY